MTQTEQMGRMLRRRPWQPLVLVLVLVLGVAIILLFPSIRTQGCHSLGSVLPSKFCHPNAATPKWNLFYHLGGNGPWVRKKSGTVGNVLPPHCTVNQVHVLSRHAERYPTISAGIRHLELLDRLQAPSTRLLGSLAFVKDWKYFTDPTSPEFEDLTSTGPYAGTLQAFTAGERLRERYDHLVPAEGLVNFWSCGSGRDIATARHFAEGFFGDDWEEHALAKLHIIPETSARGGDTLTPGRSCAAYLSDDDTGHDQGYARLEQWQTIFTSPIIKRLHPCAPDTPFTAMDIYSMMEMCGFDILVRGGSEWCSVFTHAEWLDFEYGRDLLHFYRAGPGNKYAGAMGLLWLEATQGLLSNETATGVYLSFAHDGDLIPVMAALELFDEPGGTQVLPADRRKAARKWRTSDLVPMSGRLVFERVECQRDGRGGEGNESFVRLLVNDGHIAMRDAGMEELLRHDLTVDDFEKMIHAKRRKFGDFREVCGLDESCPDRITFLHQ